MAEITVWTKQNKAVLEQLSADGRFIAKESFIRKELQDTADIMLYIYRWLASHMPLTDTRPSDALYPVWVSFAQEATMMPETGYTILELKVPEKMIQPVNIAKWTRITNYGYIPLNEADEKEHNLFMKDMGIDNATAVMTRFYPEVKEKIVASWDRLFDDSVSLGSDSAYGLIWEVKREWCRY